VAIAHNPRHGTHRGYARRGAWLCRDRRRDLRSSDRRWSEARIPTGAGTCGI